MSPQHRRKVVVAATRKRPLRKRAAAKPACVVGVGLASADLLFVCPRHEERLVEASVFSMQGGGSAANMLAALAVMGQATRFFGRIGGDEHGRFITRSLQDLGVDISMLLIEKDRVSPVSILQIDELSRRRKILRSRGNVTPLAARDIPSRLLVDAAMLLIDGSQPEPQAAIAERARDQHIPVLLNASQLSGGMGELLSLSEIVIGSERFAHELAPADNLGDSLREILSLGPRVAVITMGEAGSIGLEGSKLVEQASLDVLVADTSGAGDAFAGGFAFACLRGWPLERAVPYANAAAGLVCRNLGARAALPTAEEVIAAMDGVRPQPAP
ncbi:MAG: PfkB family carbohydrate kinase [Polyangia bacterium]